MRLGADRGTIGLAGYERYKMYVKKGAIFAGKVCVSKKTGQIIS